MKECLVPGSFDPITNGHLDIITRARRLFDSVLVGILVNVRKKGMFTPQERLRMVQGAVEGMGNVRVRIWDGLLVDLLREERMDTVVRGVRNGTDLASEQQLASLNRQLYGCCETVLLPAGEGLEAVSSSAVRELMAFGTDIAPFVPRSVLSVRKEKHENI